MNLIPCLRYADAHRALDWLETAFGFQRTVVHPGEDGQIAHAEMRFADSVIMLGSDRLDGLGFGSPLRSGTATSAIYVIIDDPDSLYARAREAGAKIIMELTDQPYGSREFAAEDFEGNVWSFGTYRPSLTAG